MKNIISVLLPLILILNISCSGDKTDQELLEKDKKELVENLDSYKVSTYKFAKILIRSSAEKDTISPEFQAFKKDLDKIFDKVVKYNEKDKESLTVLDYISIYRDYKNMEDFIMETDEDVFPTLVDAFNVAYGDSINKKREYFTGDDKIYVENIEHSVLSAIVILSKDLGKEVSLYECSQTQPELLPDSEIKALLQYFRGFLFFEKGLYYLSEDEISRNIEWLDNNKDVNLPFTRTMFQWGNLNNEQTHIAFHSLNHLFRGFDRLMMEREIDEERALEDFEKFINDAKEIGLDNEIVWSVETYFYLKNEESEKAIEALTRLRTSVLLSTSDKERIDESIEFIKNREPGAVLNGVFDKFFLAKIATKYIFSILSEIDWEQVMKDNDIPHTEEIFGTIDKLNNFLENLEKYTSAEKLKETGEDIKNSGKSLWDKAKELTE